MKLFLVHVGYYEPELAYGVFESHTNFFVAAEDERAAKKQVLVKPIFQNKKMHIDGIQEIAAVDGYTIKLEKDENASETIHSLGYSESKALA